MMIPAKTTHIRPTLTLLDDHLIQRIIAEAREVLCKLGVEIDNRPVLDTLACGLSLSEIPFCLRRWHLSDADLVVRAGFHAVFDVPLPRCAGVGAHRSPAPDRGPEALCQETAEA